MRKRMEADWRGSHEWTNRSQTIGKGTRERSGKTTVVLIGENGRSYWRTSRRGGSSIQWFKARDLQGSYLYTLKGMKEERSVGKKVFRKTLAGEGKKDQLHQETDRKLQ